MKELSVIIPVYNNEGSLQALCARLTDHIEQFSSSYEIIFIDDKSRDGSAKLLEHITAGNPNIVAILHSVNLGQQMAIRTGLQTAKGEKIAVMDADLQDDPTLLYAMLQNVDNKTSCFIKRIGNYQSLPKMLTSRLLKLIIQLIIGLNFRAGCYFVAHKITIDRILKSDVRHPYISILVAGLSTKITYVNAFRSKRADGQSSYSFGKRLKMAIHAIDCAFKCRMLQRS